MKKYLGLLVGGLLLATVASANTISYTCLEVSSGNGTYTIASTSIGCQEWNSALFGGQVLYSAIVNIEDSFNGGNPENPTNTVQYSYTGIPSADGLGLTSYTDTESALVAAGDFLQLGNKVSGLGLAPWEGTGTIGVGAVSSLATVGGPEDTGAQGGQSTVEVRVTYTYGALPEPMTMALVGGGLLGVGLLAGKRRKKA